MSFSVKEQWLDIESKKYFTLRIEDPSQIPSQLPEGYVRIQYDSSKVKVDQLLQLSSENVKFVDCVEPETNIRSLIPFLASEQPDKLLIKYLDLQGADQKTKDVLLESLKEITNEIH